MVCKLDYYPTSISVPCKCGRVINITLDGNEGGTESRKCECGIAVYVTLTVGYAVD